MVFSFAEKAECGKEDCVKFSKGSQSNFRRLDPYTLPAGLVLSAQKYGNVITINRNSKLRADKQDAQQAYCEGVFSPRFLRSTAVALIR